MKMLVCEGGADTEPRNARGLSALDQGRLVAGSQYYHPLLQPGKFIAASVDSKAEEEKGE